MFKVSGFKAANRRPSLQGLSQIRGRLPPVCGKHDVQRLVIYLAPRLQSIEVQPVSWQWRRGLWTEAGDSQTNDPAHGRLIFMIYCEFSGLLSRCEAADYESKCWDRPDLQEHID